MEMTEERKQALNAYLLANPELVKELEGLGKEKDEKTLDNEDKESAKLKAQMEELKAQIADLQKPDPKQEKLLNIDPSENGDPTWGYGKLGKGMNGLSYFAKDLHRLAIHGEMSDNLNRIKNATKAAGAGMQEGVDSEGGFLVPVEYRTELLQTGIQKSEFMNRTTSIPMQVNTVKIPYVRDVDRSGGTIHGGIRLYYTAEEGTLTASKPTYGEVTLSLNKLIGLAYASSEILEDSPISVGPLLASLFTDAWSWQTDYDILNGTGTGQPQGVLNATALVSQAKETEQAATTIVAENVIKMYSRMPGANKRNGIWIINEDCFPALSTMTIDVGTGGVPVYMPANSLANQPYDTLLGKPLIQAEHCQTLGTVGDIYFVDLSQMLTGMKAGAGVRQDTSIHLKFDTDESAFRFVWRWDCKCWWPSALTPRHSSSTLSPLVALATRS